MKLSQLEHLTKSIRQSADSRGLDDPDIDFWEISKDFAGSFREFDLDGCVFEAIDPRVFCCKLGQPNVYSLPVRITKR